eukprot:28246_1
MALVLALLLMQQLNAQAPHTGHGCFSSTCPEPGQVRHNAVINAQGDWIGGCNCGCPWAVYDHSHPTYCSSPNVVNFNPITMLGDCSCIPRAPTPVPTTPAPTAPTVALPTPTIGQPTVPTVAVHNPNVLEPTPAPVAIVPIHIEVTCDLRGPCACPVGHVGACTIICEGANDPDACKDAVIECNNDGYPCEVYCNGMNACAGSSSIMGPAGSSLSIFCIGDNSCEGPAQFNGEAGTDMTVVCDGMTSCSGVQFNFGSAVSKVECNGEQTSCIGTVFNLLPDARDTPGAAYSCAGSFCPTAGVFAPEPFSNIFVGPSGCNDVGPCACPPGANEACQITCIGHPDACKDGIIACNSDGFDCVVNCMSEQACSGSTEIIGPRGASLTVNCMGPKACEGSTVINAVESTDVTVFCEGSAACKGSVEVHFGSGTGSIYCNGDPDSCEGIVLNVQDIPGAAFSCNGAHCPVDTVIRQQTPIAVEAVPSPVAVVPTPAPTAPRPGAVDVVPQTAHCCRTSIENFKPWAGRCWDEITEATCLAEPNRRCLWDPTNCFVGHPVNSIKWTACAFYEEPCVDRTDCCSEICNPAGFCR